MCHGIEIFNSPVMAKEGFEVNERRKIIAD
jgi:hypothetical protein